MKKAKLFSSILATALAGILCFSVAACDDNPKPSENSGEQGGTVNPSAPAVSISIGAGAPTEIRKGEQVTLTVTVTNTDNKNYTWSVTDSTGAASDILAVSAENAVTVEKDVQLNTPVTVTATSEADPTKSASHTFTVIPSIAGQVGELTAEALEAVSGSNITVSGTVTDYYEDLQYSANNVTTVYNSVVKMSDGAWYGEWSAEEEGNNVIVNNYRAGDQYGNLGHALVSVYIDKDNEVAERAETNYQSIPLIWENQHLYNHLGELGTNISKKFVHDVDTDEYIYQIEPSGAYDTDASPDEYLMAYLAVSLTPMIEAGENFTQFRLKMTDGAITGIWAQTAVATVTAGDGETVLERSYTEVELTISDVGTTEVPKPAKYTIPEGDAEYFEYLEQAVGTMKAAKNFTFVAKETAVDAVDWSEGDYDIESAGGGIATVSSVVPLADTAQYYHKQTASQPPKDLGSSTGTIGYVTENAAIFETVGKYSASMDGLDYHFGYSGYRQFDGYYEVVDDEQVYTSVKGLIGVERRQGNFFEVAMPQWDFDPAIFEYIGSHNVGSSSNRTEVHDFILRDSFITNDVSRQISAHDYAEDGEGMPFNTLTISVALDADGNAYIYSTEFPYNVSGVGTGYITTTYKNVGNTTLLANAFDEGYYIERVWRDTWNKYTTHDYNPTHTSGESSDADAETVLRHMFPKLTNLNQLPAPSIIMEHICDDVNGPWFDYSLNDDGSLKREEFSFNCAMNDDDPRLDRNGIVIDIEAILGESGELSQDILKVSGWEYDRQNSGYRTAGNPTTSYFATYFNESLGIMLVVENNHTKNFFFDFYALGKWSLNRD